MHITLIRCVLFAFQHDHQMCTTQTANYVCGLSASAALTPISSVCLSDMHFVRRLLCCAVILVVWRLPIMRSIRTRELAGAWRVHFANTIMFTIDARLDITRIILRDSRDSTYCTSSWCGNRAALLKQSVTICAHSV